MALLALLAHAVQDLFRLLACFAVHAGLRDFFLELPHIGNVFRVHVVQFFLEIIDLLLQRGFPVKLFLVVLLGFLGLGGDFGDLHEFPDGPADQVITLPDRVGRQDPVFLLYGQVQIFRQGRSHVVDILPLENVPPRPKAPLVALDETEQVGAQSSEYILLFFFRHILHARAHNKGRPDVAVLNDRIEDLHPVQSADLDHIFIADIFNPCGNADGIEVIGFETVAVCFVFQHDKQELRVGFKFAASVFEEILLKEIGDIGQKEYIVNWLDKHMHHPFHIMSVIGWCKIISTQTRRVLIHI